MSIDALLVHDVTILTPGTTTSRYGDTAKDWSTATATDVAGWISQRSASEVLDQREAQIGGWVLFLPADTDITGRDRVTWGDLTFEVAGPPTRAWTPRGEHHIEVPLRIVEG